MYLALQPYYPPTFSLQAYCALEQRTKAATLPFSTLVGLVNYCSACANLTAQEVIEAIAQEAIRDQDKRLRKNPRARK